MMRPESLGALAFTIDAMERLEAGESNSDLICELSPAELQIALGMALGMLWMANRLLAGFTGESFADAMQAFRRYAAVS